MEDLLFLTQRIPYPPDKGDKIRAYHELRYLAKRYRIHLGCFRDHPSDQEHIAALRKLCASVQCLPLNKKTATLRGLMGLAAGRSLSKYYFCDGKMTRWVTDTLTKFPIKKIFVFCSAMAPYVLGYQNDHHIVLDMVDVDSEKWRAYGARVYWPVRTLYGMEQRALNALERKCACSFAHSAFVSHAEAATFLEGAPHCASRVSYFNNGVDLDYFDPDQAYDNPYQSKLRPIVFTGTMNYPPNVEAVIWFAREVLPLLRRADLQVGFWIVGQSPSKSVLKLAQDPVVTVTGRIKDVRPYLAHAACVVAPLQLARGIQNKVLEGMAMGKSIVATPAACEGLMVTSGREILLAQTPQGFSNAVRDVLCGVHSELGTHARQRVLADHDWERNLGVLGRLLESNGAADRICNQEENRSPASLRDDASS